MLNENPGGACRGLSTLCERSAYIADQIARYPVLLDELLDPERRLRHRLTLDEQDAELEDRLHRVRRG